MPTANEEMCTMGMDMLTREQASSLGVFMVMVCIRCVVVVTSVPEGSRHIVLFSLGGFHLVRTR